MFIEWSYQKGILKMCKTLSVGSVNIRHVFDFRNVVLPPLFAYFFASFIS